jgi:DNA modification methylase
VNDPDFTLYVGDALEVLRGLPPSSADAVVMSPPYLNARPEYPSPTIQDFQAIFQELARVVTCRVLVNVGRTWHRRTERLWWVDLLQAATIGDWRHVDTLVWIKPNSNPIHGEVFADRHEYVFALAKPGAGFNTDAVRVPYAASSVPRLKRGWTNHVGVKGDDSRRRGRRKSEPHPLGGRPPSYISVRTGGEKGNPHPAPMPLQLAEHLVRLGSWPNETVLDPFAGSGTTCLAARRLGRRSIGIELNPEYAELTARRLSQLSLLAEPA